MSAPTPLRRFRLIETGDGAEMKADPQGAYVLYSDLSESAPRMICYVPCKAHEGMPFEITLGGYATPAVLVCPICNPPSNKG